MTPSVKFIFAWTNIAASFDECCALLSSKVSCWNCFVHSCPEATTTTRKSACQFPPLHYYPPRCSKMAEKKIYSSHGSYNHELLTTSSLPLSTCHDSFTWAIPHSAFSCSYGIVSFRVLAIWIYWISGTVVAVGLSQTVTDVCMLFGIVWSGQVSDYVLVISERLLLKRNEHLRALENGSSFHSVAVWRCSLQSRDDFKGW